jgi:tRNA (guanine37-N1)-methyltransferase
LLKSNQLLSNKKPIRKDDFVFFPISDSQVIPDLLKNISYVLEELFFPEKAHNVDISDILNSEFPNVNINEISTKYDQLGEIGVLRLDPYKTSLAFRRRVGNLILLQSPKLKTVLNKTDIVDGTQRIYPIEHLSGVKTTQSWHQEYSVFIFFDIEKTYFNPRLAEEHHRVAESVKSGEKILDLFCGVGPFSLHAAKRKSCQISAVDINPFAIFALKKSMNRNKLRGDINPIIGDSLSIFQAKHQFSRIIMNLPQKSIEFLPYAISMLKTGGIITFYQFLSNSENPIVEIKKMIGSKISEVHSYKILFAKVGREISPTKLQMNIDIQIE